MTEQEIDLIVVGLLAVVCFLILPFGDFEQ